MLDFTKNSFEIHSLASGSSGNALLIRGSQTILLDCGISGRQLSAKLASVNCAVDEIDVVFLSHEHIDHVRGLKALVGPGTELVTSRGTGAALGFTSKEFRIVRSNAAIHLDSCTLTPIATSHDAAEPLAVFLEIGGICLTVATDLGEVTEAVSEALISSDIAILEANHDLEMIRNGPYPQNLKRRVLGKKGHLSNLDCARALESIHAESSRLQSIWLAHLSTTNNLPSLATTTVQARNRGLSVTALPRTQVLSLDIDIHRIQSAAVMPVQTAFW